VRSFVVGLGIGTVGIRDLMPLGAVWTVEDGTQPFDPPIIEDVHASADQYRTQTDQ
jgi:hypothetical protein